VIRAGSLAWFAKHELRLAWRDWRLLMIAGSRRRSRAMLVGFAAFALFLHGFAYLMYAPYANLASAPNTHLYLVVTAMLVLSFSLMLSQAMESVTRAFYARADLDLILSSPIAAWRLFAVRIGAMVVTVFLMTLVLAAPFLNVLAWRGGARWLAGYGVVAALAMVAVAVAVAATVALFRTIGPRRTRIAAQILSAMIGAAFVIVLQLAAILSYGTMARMAFLQSEMVNAYAPASTSILWWPARAVAGDATALLALLGIGTAVLGGAIWIFAPRFSRFALIAASVSHSPRRKPRRSYAFRNMSPAQALRRKEWALLRRDPWLASQTLLQLLYLLPPAFLCWRSFSEGSSVSTLLVPVLITVAGQLGGGLAWIAVSGEDAPDLVASSPVPLARVLRAKTEAVMGGIAVVFVPFLLVLTVLAPFAALVALLGIAISATSATAIQFWFRTQAKRDKIRRRQTSSRIATYAEALSAIGWGATGALAAAGAWVAIFPGCFAAAILAGTWMISPARS
jgi:ABC-2 type transport system permease protein